MVEVHRGVEEPVPRFPRLRINSAGTSFQTWSGTSFSGTSFSPNNGRIRRLTSRSDAAHKASVSLIDAVCVHDLRIIVAHGFRNLQKAQL